MITGAYFEGDCNLGVMELQHEDYHRMIGHLVGNARKIYLSYDWYRWMDSSLHKRLETMASFDHRVIQAAHDLIAASFRYLFCWHDEDKVFPEGYRVKETYLDAWRAYYEKENLGLISQRPVLLAIVLALAYQNTEKGYAAESELENLLLDRYTFLRGKRAKEDGTQMSE